MNFFSKKGYIYLFISMLLVLVTVLTTLIAPFILNSINSYQSTTIFPIIFLIIGAMSLSYLFQVCLIIYRENFAKKFNLNSISDLLAKIYTLKFEKYINLESGNLVTRIFRIVDTSYMFMTTSFFLVLKSAISILIVLGIFLTLDSTIFLITLLLIPINIFSYLFINKTLNQRIKTMQDENANAQKDLILLLGNPEQFKMLPSFDTVKQLTSKTLKKMYTSLAATNKFAQITSYTVSFINQLSQNIIFITISYLVYNQQLQLNNMMVVSILMPIFFTSLSDLSKINVDYRTVVANQQFVQENLELHQEDLFGTPIDPITSIKFTDPQITMPLNAKRIHLSLTETLNLGDICYIEGPSGSGKSTLIKAILSFYASNGIYINDFPLDQLNGKQVREQITYLSQTTLLFSNTLEYNITLGQPISEEKKEALRNSTLLAPIFKNKDWDSLIIDNGANLSGGEKQRVFIARMILQDSRIWILDESTSSIDKDSADAIFDTLMNVRQNKIILFTSHDKKNKNFANKFIQISSRVETIV
ncbi:hypothetical protein IGK16_000032 [Enterococcus pernyi]|uniref:ATP-binding cassette domain-containing protein n=1 Tax=unclassified Enterococcus TaxID=2608891 RepID=UPI000789B1DB